MPLYSYTARDASGKKIHDFMEVSNETALLEKLRKKRFMVLSVAEEKETGKQDKGITKLFAPGSRRIVERVKLAVLLSFTTQLSAMLDAGLPLVQSLGGLALDIKDKRFRETIEKVETNVREGNSFSDSLEKFPGIFNKIFVNLIKAGEISGKLGLILAQLTTYLEYHANLRRKVKSALIYPVVVVAFALFVILFMLVKIIPKFQKIYSDLGRELPLPTRLLIGISDMLQSNFFLWLLLIVGIVGLGLFFRKTPRGRLILDQTKLNLPIFGPLLKKSILSNFSRTLSILVRSGIPLVQAMRLATQSINNLVITNSLSQIADNIERGGGVGESFRKSGIFPEMMLQMITTGEKTGAIDDMIIKVSTFYDQQIDATVNTLTTLIEPLVIIIIGTLIGGIMLAMFLPVFKMGGAMQ
ncbi:MAG: type II secretion system F family protein [Thermodesulfobacteriota bacterium]|nr:type II secretion system F family protein [Thermodesulfobacteriota bacterium]